MNPQSDLSKNEETTVVALAVAGIPVLIASVISVVLLSGAWNAFVLHKLSNWFAHPVGLPVISWGQAWGLMMIYNLVTYRPIAKQQQTDAHPWRTMFVQILIRFFSGAFCLLVGWLILVWSL